MYLFLVVGIGNYTTSLAVLKKLDVDCGHIRASNILKLSEYNVIILKYIISKYQRPGRSVDEERGLSRMI